MANANIGLYRLKPNPVDRSTGAICDQIVRPNGINSKTRFHEQIRRIKYRDPETEKVLVFLTNSFTLSAKTIAALYKSRWQIEPFMKWIKQHHPIWSFVILPRMR